MLFVVFSIPSFKLTIASVKNNATGVASMGSTDLELQSEACSSPASSLLSGFTDLSLRRCVVVAVFFLPVAGAVSVRHPMAAGTVNTRESSNDDS